MFDSQGGPAESSPRPSKEGASLYFVLQLLDHVLCYTMCDWCVTQRMQHQPGITPNDNTTHVTGVPCDLLFQLEHTALHHVIMAVHASVRYCLCTLSGSVESNATGMLCSIRGLAR